MARLMPLYCWISVIFADSIYHRMAAYLSCFIHGVTLIVIRRIEKAAGFILLPRRWVVERTFAWIGRWRRLSKDYEELPKVSEAMVTAAMIRLMLHRLIRPNRRRLPPP
jgi:putative transposase